MKPEGFRKKGDGAHRRPLYNQAAKIIARFGTANDLARALGISRQTVWRWQSQKPVGTDGLIPSSAIESIERAARIEGIVLTPQDWRPERIHYESEATA